MKRKIALSLLACLSIAFAWSQNKQVTGRVLKENSSEGLAGVSVTVKGTRTATVTNNTGNFSISVPDNADAALVFSYIGFKQQEIPVKGLSVIDVTMAEEATAAMSEVVVVGYSTMRRRDLSGAV